METIFAEQEKQQIVWKKNMYNFHRDTVYRCELHFMFKY